MPTRKHHNRSAWRLSPFEASLCVMSLACIMGALWTAGVV
jgi:hypothetical protein